MVAHTGVDHVGIGLAVGGVAAYGWAWLRHPTPDGMAAGMARASGRSSLASSPWMERPRRGELHRAHGPAPAGDRRGRAAARARRAGAHDRARRLDPDDGGRPGLGAAWRRWPCSVGPLAFVAVLFVTHLTSDLRPRSTTAWLHELEHAAYLLGAVLRGRRCSAAPGVGRRPRRRGLRRRGRRRAARHGPALGAASR